MLLNLRFFFTYLFVSCLVEIDFSMFSLLVFASVLLWKSLWHMKRLKTTPKSDSMCSFLSWGEKWGRWELVWPSSRAPGSQGLIGWGASWAQFPASGTELISPASTLELPGKPEKKHWCWGSPLRLMGVWLLGFALRDSWDFAEWSRWDPLASED